jgi:hypothetical protein
MQFAALFAALADFADASLMLAARRSPYEYYTREQEARSAYLMGRSNGGMARRMNRAFEAPFMCHPLSFSLNCT